MIRALPPQVHSNRQGFEALARVAHTTRDLFADYLEIDMSRVRWFDANMSAPLGVILARVAENINSLAVVDIPDTIEEILRKNHFLTQFKFEPLPDTNHTTMLFRRIRNSASAEFQSYIDQQLEGKGLPTMSSEARRIFKKSVFEIQENAVSHAESARGLFVCGQFFPQKHRLKFTMADAGIGIRDNVRRFFRKAEIPSVPAMKWALKLHHTTKEDSRPGGLGFDFLKRFTSMNGGSLQIVSRHAFYEFRNSEDRFEKMSADYPGTAVTIEVNTSDTARYVVAREGPVLDDLPRRRA